MNQRPPNVYFKRKKTGGVSVSASCQLVNITERDVNQLLHEYRIHSAEVGSRWWAVGGGQRVVGSRWWAVGGGQRVVGSRKEGNPS